MKKLLLSFALCLLPLVITSCGLEEVCENEAQQVRITSSTGAAFLTVTSSQDGLAGPKLYALARGCDVLHLRAKFF